MGRGRYNSHGGWYEHERARRENDDNDEEEYYLDDDADDENYDRQPPPRSYRPAPGPTPRRASRQPISRDYHDSYEDEDFEVRPSRRATSAARQAYNAPPRRRPQGKRRVWPVLLTGCALGIVVAVLAAAVVVITFIHSIQGETGAPGLSGIVGVGTKPFSKADTVQVPLASIAQIQICDRVGDVSINVNPDANADQTTVTTTRTVHMASQSDADQEFKRISVEVQPPTTLTLPLTCARPQSATPTTTGSPTATDSATAVTTPTDVATPVTTGAQNTLIVNVTFPENGAVGDSVDIAITVPRKALQDELFTRQLNIEAPLGKVSVDGLSGILNIKGGSDVAVKNVILAPASRLETAQGTVHFSGYLDVPPDATQDTHYIIQGEHGIDVTLLSSANVVLDANTNEGTGVITNEFDSTASKTNHPVNYYGPLDPSSSSKPVAILTLDVGSGNITIHKSTS